jgi:hypothetical protein
MKIEPKINLSSDERVDGVESGLSSTSPEIDSIQSNVKKNNLFNISGQSSSSASSTSSSNSTDDEYVSGAVKLPIKVTNITTSHQIHDTLYQNSKVWQKLLQNNHAQ